MEDALHKCPVCPVCHSLRWCGNEGRGTVSRRKKLLFFFILYKLPSPPPPNLDNLYNFFPTSDFKTWITGLFWLERNKSATEQIAWSASSKHGLKRACKFRETQQHRELQRVANQASPRGHTGNYSWAPENQCLDTFNMYKAINTKTIQCFERYQGKANAHHLRRSLY